MCRDGQTQLTHSYIICNPEFPVEKAALVMKRSRCEGELQLRRSLTDPEWHAHAPKSEKSGVKSEKSEVSARLPDPVFNTHGG